MNRLTHKAEEALLGAMLFRPEALPSMRWIPPGAFYRPDLSVLWQTLHSIDWSTVSRDAVPATITAAVGQIKEPGIRQCLTPSRLAHLVSACPDPRTAALYGGMTLEAAIHRSVEQAGTALRQTARETEADQARETLADIDSTSRRLAALGSAWSAAPETVRNLLDTTPDEPVTPAPRTERTRINLRAEAETLASLLYQPAQIAEVTGWLRAGDFSDPQLAAVYQAMSTLADRHAPIDALTVAWEAARQPGVQPSEQVLDELAREGTPGTAAYTGEQVLATASLDRLDEAGHQMRSLALHPALAPTALLDHAEQAMAPVAADRHRIHHAEREQELAPSDKEPAPAMPGAPHHDAPAHEMEMDL